MSSLLIHNIEEDMDEEALTLIFESLNKMVKNISNIDVSDIELSRDFKSAVINFKDERTAKKIFESEIKFMIENYPISLIHTDKMFIINPLNQEYQNNVIKVPLISEQSEFQQMNSCSDALNINSSQTRLSNPMLDSNIKTENAKIESILIHNIYNYDEEDLILIFESLHKSDVNINKIDVLDIQFSKHFKSAILKFNDKKSANEILTSELQITKGNNYFILMPNNQIFINPVNVPFEAKKQNDNTNTNSLFNSNSTKNTNSITDLCTFTPTYNDKHLIVNNSSNFIINKHKSNDDAVNNLNGNSIYQSNINSTLLYNNHLNNSNIRWEASTSSNQNKPSYSEIVKSNKLSDSIGSYKNYGSYSQNIDCNSIYTFKNNSHQSNLNSKFKNINSETISKDNDDDNWEYVPAEYNNNISNNTCNVKSMINQNIGNPNSVQIKLEETKLPIKDKIILIRRMILAERIKSGFSLSTDDNNLVLLSYHNKDDLMIYKYELEEIFNLHCSQTELDVFNVIKKQLKTDYGIKWANSILNDNKIVGIFDPKNLSILGFIPDETDKGAFSIKTHLAVSRLKKTNINIHRYSDVVIQEVEKITYVIGLPRDVIKVLKSFGY